MLLYRCRKEVNPKDIKFTERRKFKMKKISKKIMEVAAKVGMNTAVKACGSTSYYGCHQPIEPKSLKKMIK